jgi:hypothetical protein
MEVIRHSPCSISQLVETQGLGGSGTLAEKDQEKTLLLYNIKPSWLLVTQEGRKGDIICNEIF